MSSGNLSPKLTSQPFSSVFSALEPLKTSNGKIRRKEVGQFAKVAFVLDLKKKKNLFL